LSLGKPPMTAEACGTGTRDHATATEAGVAPIGSRLPCANLRACHELNWMCAPTPFLCYTVCIDHSIHVATQSGGTSSRVTVLHGEVHALHVHAHCRQLLLLACRGQSVLLQGPVRDQQMVLGNHQPGSDLQWCRWASSPNLDVRLVPTEVMPCVDICLRLKAWNTHNRLGTQWFLCAGIFFSGPSFLLLSRVLVL
jgi:hypothetical protein